MDEKNNQTTAMLNDEKHPTRTGIDDNRPPLRKVIFSRKYYFNKFFFFY